MLLFRPIPIQCMVDVVLGIQLLEIEIAPNQLRVVAKGRNGCGYDRTIVPYQGHLQVISRCIVGSSDYLIYTEFVRNYGNQPYYRLLRFVIESLYHKIEIDQLKFHVVWDQCRASQADLAAFADFKRECIRELTSSFEERMGNNINQPLEVRRFFIEYDGSAQCQQEIQVFLDNIKMIEPYEIEITSPRDLAVRSELHLDCHVTQSAGWNEARKLTIREGFWTRMEPKNWENLCTFETTIWQITDVVIQNILRASHLIFRHEKLKIFFEISCEFERKLGGSEIFEFPSFFKKKKPEKSKKIPISCFQNLLTSTKFVSCIIYFVVTHHWSFRLIMASAEEVQPDVEYLYEGALRCRTDARWIAIDRV